MKKPTRLHDELCDQVSHGQRLEAVLRSDALHGAEGERKTSWACKAIRLARNLESVVRRSEKLADFDLAQRAEARRLEKLLTEFARDNLCTPGPVNLRAVASGCGAADGPAAAVAVDLGKRPALRPTMSLTR